MSTCMKERKCKQVRVSKNLTKAQVARDAVMQASVVGWIEEGRFIPYESQLTKLAKALGWDGDPQELLEEVK